MCNENICIDFIILYLDALFTLALLYILKISKIISNGL